MITERPSFKEALKFWLKLGFISFGGPAGQIAIMHEFLVEKKRWISDSRFLHALNYCMVLPGPEAQQLATYIGWLLHGVRGGLVAGILFVLPSLFILLGLSIVYVLYGDVKWVTAVFYGLKPAVVAVVILALIKIGKKSLISPFHYGAAAMSFVLIFFFNVSFPLIILVALLLAVMAKSFFPEVLKTQENKADISNEQGYFINSLSPPVRKGTHWKSVATKLIIGITLWILPFGFYEWLTNDPTFWNTLSWFFTKAAFVTFGGAYAVLPYVAQESVEKFHWLSEYEMIDGLALGETTPGPLIMVLVFVGFMAGYHHSGLLSGAAGLLVTAFYTFLPCFLFILIGAPLVERTSDNVKVKSLLSVITAAVVGVILNLTIYFGDAVVVPNGQVDWFALVWIAVSLFAMYRYNIGMITWIMISAIAGVLHLLIF